MVRRIWRVAWFASDDLPLAANIPKKDLLLFDYPDDKLKEVGVTGIFIGHYFPWIQFKI